MPTVLSTRRLKLVAIERRHLPELLRLWTDPRVMGNVGFPEGLDPADIDLESYLSHTPGATATGGRPGVYMAVELSDGTFVGEAKLGAPDPTGSSEPDLKLLPAYWRRGYGREIVSALIEESFRRWPSCRRVVFTPNVDNRAAQALYQAAGARRVGDGNDPAGGIPLKGFVGVRYVVMAIDRGTDQERSR